MNILVVDDNAPSLYLLQVLLGREGYQVVPALNGAEALDKARQNPPDLIVSDILMPVMDGFALCREWKSDIRLRQIPFVFYTATYTDERDQEFALSLGAERFLVKPAVEAVFIRTIREVIQQPQRPPTPKALLAANTPDRLLLQVPQEEGAGYLKQYNEVLIRKLEAKMEQLEQINRELERDINARKQIEAELRKQQHFVEAVLASAHSGIVACDERGVLTHVNRAMRDMHHLPPEAIPAEEWARHHDLYLADGKTPMKTGDMPLVRALQGEQLNNLEMMIIPKGGEPRVVLASGQPIVDPEGQNLGAVVVMHDITDRKRAEAESARLVAAIEQSAEVMMITDTRGTIEYVNPAFTRITGYSREDVLGRNPSILKSDKQDRALYQQLWETILEGQTWHGELINQRKDGSSYTEQVNIAPVRSARGEVTHFIATNQDVTERKSLEAQIQQAAKMEAIGGLAGGVAHDFNNLLTVINGYVDLLLMDLAPDNKVSDYLKEIGNAGERAASLTRQLLAFSRRQLLAPRVLDLNTVVSNMEKMLGRLIGDDIKLRTVLDPLLGRVKADPCQIEQVIMNLAVNARDAMPTGGSLTIETGNVELDEAYAQSHVTTKPGPHVMMAVHDTGIGIAPETIARIFEPFFTTKGVGKGTGLGLATAYGIVKQSGGSIWVYSEPCHGTVFKVYFPVVREGLVANGHSETETDSALGSETVLVVEDAKAVRTLVRLALESCGYKVLDMQDAKSTLELCVNYGEAIHLLLTDVVMPEMSGPSLAAKVTALRPDMKVLYMSGYTDDSVVRHGVVSQGMSFIQKPFSPIALRKKIREVLNTK